MKRHPLYDHEDIYSQNILPCEFRFLSDLKNQTIVSSCVTHILPSCGYFKGQEQICFNPTSWHLVTYNLLQGHKF